MKYSGPEIPFKVLSRCDLGQLLDTDVALLGVAGRGNFQ